MKVSKFGGSSVANDIQIKKVLNIINSDNDRKIAVVSAPGKRHEQDIKITDLLIQLYNEVVKCDSEALSIKLSTPYSTINELISSVTSRYAEIESSFRIVNDVSSEMEATLKHYIHTLHTKPERLNDALKSAGENFNAKLIAQINNTLGHPTVYLSPADLGMIVTDEPSNAQLLNTSYDNIKNKVDQYKAEKIIIPGFFGVSEAGEIVTFSRGGSDITGAIIARSINAVVYENFTDVSGIFAANPSIIQNPKTINALTYNEMRELSYAGFKVFHDEALTPIVKTDIPVVIKNTNHPDDEGTYIQHTKQSTGVVGVSCDKGFVSINMKKYLMNRELGFTRKLLTILEKLNISYEHMPSGIDNVSIILRKHQLDGKQEVLLKEIKDILNVDELTVEDNIAILMIVGEGMKTAIGTASRATTALSTHQVNLKMINQGSSEISIMFGIDEKDNEKAVKAVYAAFFE